MSKLILEGEEETIKDIIYSINHDNKTSLLEACKKVKGRFEE